VVFLSCLFVLWVCGEAGGALVLFVCTTYPKRPVIFMSYKKKKNSSTILIWISLVEEYFFICPYPQKKTENNSYILKENQKKLEL
jgi:hypothetical protein